MAIDPTISLQVHPTQGIGPDWSSINQTAMTAAQIPQIQAQTANIQAELPAIQAQAAMTSRQNQAQQWLQDNAEKYITVDPMTGQKTFDSNAAANGVALAGFPDMGSALAANYLHNNILGTQAATDRFNMVNGMRNTMTSILGTEPPGPALNAQASQYMHTMNTAGTSPDTGIAAGTSVFSPFMARDNNGNLITDSNGNPVIDAVAMNAQRMSQVSPQIQEQIREQRALNHTSPDAMNPNSSMSQSTQQLAVELGYAKPGDPPQSDFYWYNYRPDFVQAMKNNYQSMSVQDQYRLTGTDFGRKAQLADSAISVLQSSGVANDGNYLSQRVNQFLSIAGSNPQYAGVISAINQAKVIDSSLDFNTMSLKALLAKLHIDSKVDHQQAQYYNSKVGSAPGNVTQSVPTGNVQPGVAGVSTPSVTPPPAAQPQSAPTAKTPTQAPASQPQAQVQPAGHQPGAQPVTMAQVYEAAQAKNLPIAKVIADIKNHPDKFYLVQQ